MKTTAAAKNTTRVAAATKALRAAKKPSPRGTKRRTTTAKAKAKAKGKGKAKRTSAATAAPVPTSTTTIAPGPSVADLTEEVKNLKRRLAEVEERLARRVDQVDTQVSRLAKRVKQTPSTPRAAHFQGQAAAAAPEPEQTFTPSTPPAQTRNRLGLTVQTNLPFPPTPESATSSNLNDPCTSCTLRASPTIASGPYDPDHLHSGRSAPFPLTSTSELFVTRSFPDLLAYRLGPLVAPLFEHIPRRVDMVLIMNTIPTTAWAQDTDEEIAKRCNERLEDPNWGHIIRTLRYIFVKGGLLDVAIHEWIGEEGGFVMWEEDLDEDFLGYYDE